jgi:hypothetical protein
MWLGVRKSWQTLLHKSMDGNSLVVGILILSTNQSKRSAFLSC